MKPIEELIKVCDAATPGRDYVRCNCGHPACHSWHWTEARSNGAIDEVDAVFNSTFNPAFVRKLLAVVEAVIAHEEGALFSNIQEALEKLENANDHT